MQVLPQAGPGFSVCRRVNKLQFPTAQKQFYPTGLAKIKAYYSGVSCSIWALTSYFPHDNYLAKRETYRLVMEKCRYGTNSCIQFDMEFCSYARWRVRRLYRTAGPINSPADAAQNSSSMGTEAKASPERALLIHHLSIMSG